MLPFLYYICRQIAFKKKDGHIQEPYTAILRRERIVLLGRPLGLAVGNGHDRPQHHELYAFKDGGQGRDCPHSPWGVCFGRTQEPVCRQTDIRGAGLGEEPERTFPVRSVVHIQRKLHRTPAASSVRQQHDIRGD